MATANTDKYNLILQRQFANPVNYPRFTNIPAPGCFINQSADYLLCHPRVVLKVKPGNALHITTVPNQSGECYDRTCARATLSQCCILGCRVKIISLN